MIDKFLINWNFKKNRILINEINNQLELNHSKTKLLKNKWLNKDTYHMARKKSTSSFLSAIVMSERLHFFGDSLKEIFLHKKKLKSPPLILKSKISIFTTNLQSFTFGILPGKKSTDQLSPLISKDVMELFLYSITQDNPHLKMLLNNGMTCVKSKPKTLS